MKPSFSFQENISSSLVSFSEKVCDISNKEELLLFLKRLIPRKFNVGEIILFYESEQFGLRRSYLKREQVYEEKAENPWPCFKEIKYGRQEESAYLATEMGRPFSKVLMIPFQEKFSETEFLPVLFVELIKFQEEESVKDFFIERFPILNLILKRVLLNTNVTHTSLLWSHVFGGLGEPLAILKNHKILRANEPFRKLLMCYPQLVFHQDTSHLLHIENSIYQIHSYPLSLEGRQEEKVRILYGQDLTKYFYLKENLLQSEKIARLEKLGENMAHQLNNPLTGIRSMAQILIQDSHLQYLSEDFKEVEIAVARSQKIIGSLLAFSKAQPSQEKFCDLKEVVQNTLPLLKTATRGIRLVLKGVEREPCFVQGELSLLQQILFNLILNACQAFEEMEENTSPQIEVCLSLTGDSKACLEVKDNGPGISEENLGKIFQPLFTTKKRGKGTGLGLGIARRFAESFGGELHATSSLRNGSCFLLSLPLNKKSYVTKT